MTFIFIAVVALLLVSSVLVRRQILDLLQGVAYYTAGVWNIIWPRIGRTVIISCLVVAIFWAGFIALLTYLGGPFTWFSGLLIGILAPLWFLAIIMPPILNKIWVLGRAIQISRWALSFILFFLVLPFVLGIISFDLQGDILRWKDNKLGEIGNGFYKKSVTSEPEIGIMVTAKETITTAYETFDKAVDVNILSGSTLMVLKQSAKDAIKATAVSEGMTYVMLPNKGGDFVNGKKYFVPTRKLNMVIESPKIIRHEAASYYDKLSKGISEGLSFAKPAELPRRNFSNQPDSEGWITLDELIFSPNFWDKDNFGWKELVHFEQPFQFGETPYPILVKIEATGEYQQWFNDGSSLGQYKSITPEGIIAWDCDCKGDFPLPNEPIGKLIAKIDGQLIPIGKSFKLKVASSLSSILITTNIGQDRAPLGNPKMNFIRNKGNWNIALKYKPV